MGTTYRSGARFGPQAVRRISALYDQYSPDLGMDLLEEISIGDAGDIFVIPANIEKTFDQIDLGLSHILDAGSFPIIIGGDHCIGFPDAKAIAKHVGASWGSSTSIGTSTPPRQPWMSGCTPLTGHMPPTLPNVPGTNLVQIGIGGWIGNHSGVKVAEERDTTVITMFDVEELGVDRAMEIALEIAWKDAAAVYLSFDIDVVDPGYAPGTGTLEPGGMSPREALKAARMVAAEGLAGVDLVEISPPYDVADTTSQLGARVIMDTLASLVDHGHLGNRVTREERERAERERDRASGISDT